MQHAPALPPPRVPVTDSRTATPGADKVFVALRGPRFDGHDFVQDAYARGIRQFLLDRPVPLPYADCTVWVVEHTLKTLQAWAGYHRAQLDVMIVAITGSNGKTIVKEWTAQLVGADLRLYRSPKSYNSQVGVALSLLEITPHHEVALIEAGISQPEEADRLRKMLDATVGVLTNLGSAHDEGFASRAQKLKEKLRILHHAHTIFCRPEEAADIYFTYNRKGIHRWWLDGESTPPGSVRGTAGLVSRKKSDDFHFAVPFTDAASVENATHAFLLARYLGISDATLRQRMPLLRPVAMRLSVRRARYDSWLLDDSYSADLSSLRIALAFFRQQNTAPTTTLILSDFLETGLPPETLYARLAETIGEPYPVRLIGIGTAIPALRAHLPTTVEQHYFPDTETALARFDWDRLRQTGILLKGARRFRFERIAARLRARSHRTELEIGLGAIRHNLHAFRSRLRASTRLLVMVKAAAYGGGGLEVARLLAAQRVDYLGVAYVDEGVALRRGGITLPILVLNPEPDSYAALLTYELEPELYSLDTLRAFGRFSSDQGTALTVHLKLDTGMHRLGFAAADLPAVLELLAEFPHLRVGSIFSHLVGSEAAAHDAFTRTQITRFETAYRSLSAGLGYRPARHLLNSAGILRYPDQQYEMVRLGIGLYGIGAAEGLRPAFTLRAALAQVRTVPPGDTVGYDRRGAAPRARRIATVSIGYADGLPRAAGNGCYALILHGVACPIVGNVCMDMCMIDVSEVPQAAAGDSVEIFGEGAPLAAFAAATGTISYEILTGIGPRVVRVYVEEE